MNVMKSKLLCDVRRNYSDDEMVDTPVKANSKYVTDFSTNLIGRHRLTDFGESKSGAVNYGNNSSGNDLSLTEGAGKKRFVDFKNPADDGGVGGEHSQRSVSFLSGVSGGGAGVGKSYGNFSTAEAQEEHQEDMIARRALWQEEVDFHEASVKRQRAAMMKEKGKMEEEQETLKTLQQQQQQSMQNVTSIHTILQTQIQGAVQGTDKNQQVRPPSPSAAADLRFKLRELESEMEEVKSLNVLLFDEKENLIKASKKDKEVTFSINRSSLICFELSLVTPFLTISYIVFLVIFPFFSHLLTYFPSPVFSFLTDPFCPSLSFPPSPLSFF